MHYTYRLLLLYATRISLTGINVTQDAHSTVCHICLSTDGDWAFPVPASRPWNILLQNVTSAPTLTALQEKPEAVMGKSKSW